MALNWTSDILPITLNQYPVWVINLNRRPDRWLHVTHMLAKHGFTRVQRLEAIDGKWLNKEVTGNLVSPQGLQTLKRPRKKHEELGTLGAIGCYLSHVKAWEEIWKSGQPGIIMEDDAKLHPSWSSFPVVRQPQSMLQNYNMVLLGHSVIRENDHDMKSIIPTISQSSDQGTLVPLKNKFFGLQCYYLTPEAAHILLVHALPIQIQVDSYISELLLNHQHTSHTSQLETSSSSSDTTHRSQPQFQPQSQFKLRTAFHYPSLVSQLQLGTDIQSPCPDCQKPPMSAIDKWLVFLMISLILLLVGFALTKIRR